MAGLNDVFGSQTEELNEAKIAPYDVCGIGVSKVIGVSYR